MTYRGFDLESNQRGAVWICRLEDSLRPNWVKTLSAPGPDQTIDMAKRFVDQVVAQETADFDKELQEYLR